jgi:hypothetical protein
MINQLMRLLLLAGVALAASSCDGILEPRSHVYDGPPVVEFAPVMPAGTYTLPVSLVANSAEDREVSVRVNYIGSPPRQNVTGAFTLASGTTAAEGTHFTIPAGKSYTIPAGSNRTEVPITIHGGALENGQSMTIVLELVPGDNVGVSENYKRFTIAMSKAGS